MRSKRVLALLLSALLLLPTLASCATGDTSTDDGSSTTASTNETNTDELKDSLPDDLDYEGDEIVIISRGNNMELADEFYATNLTGDPVNDAVFERNTTVENRLNIKITSISQDTSVLGAVINSVSSGSKDYDVMVEYCWEAAPKTIDGYFANLRSTEYLDFDQPWWTQSFNEVMSYQDVQFAVTGALVLSTYRRTYATVFNKRLFTDASQPFLYDCVENGEWTLDKQASLVPLFYKDNGNNTLDENGDIYGFVSDDFISVDPYWAACEIDILKKDTDGRYEWTLDSNKMYDAVEKVLHLYYNTNYGTYCVQEDDSFQTTTRQMFANGYAAMATLCIHGVENSTVRNMADEYGIVPIPKYDKVQTSYHSQMHDAFTIACVPTTVAGDRLDEVSAVLEALASTSYNVVRPVYYETTLRTKIAQDPQSSEMMELIISSIHIDAGVVFSHNMNSFHKIFQTLIKSKQNNTISLAKAYSAAAKKKLTSLVNRLDQLSD